MNRRLIKGALALMLAASLVVMAAPFASAMPPHPDLEKKMKEGLIARPDFLISPEILREKGINQPGVSVSVQDIALYGAPALGPTGNFNAIALLIDFSDKPSTVVASFFDILVFGASAGTVRDFYSQVSYGTLTLVTVNLPSSTNWYRAPQTYAYYTNGNYGFGSYPQNAQKLVEDVVDLADAAVNFANYDNNSDGYVDALFVVHAGRGAEYTGSPNDIWSHQWSISPRLKDGVYISTYSMEPEYWVTAGDMTCGVYAHELGHVFGLPDLYDYGYDSEGAGNWSLMAGGSWNGPYPGGGSPSHLDAWSRVALGFVTPTVLSADLMGASIGAVENAGGPIYYLWNCGDPNTECFLAENRQSIGYDAYLPGFGLLLWHVDETAYGNDYQCTNHQNCLCSNNYQVALEQADGLLNLEYNVNRGDAGDPFPGSSNKRLFDLTSTPNSGSYADCSSQVAVKNISNSGATMTADLYVCGEIPPECDPFVELLLDDTYLLPGERLTARAHVTNDATANSVEVKVWEEFPDGSMVSLYNLGSYNVAANADMTVTIFSHTFAAPEPQGQYAIGARFLNKVTGDTLCSDIETFTFSTTACGFSENFDDGVANNWTNDGSGTWSVAGGVYIMSGSMPAISTVRYSHYSETYTNFTYEMDVRRISGVDTSSLGMVFRGDGTYNNTYYFHISGNGQYLVGKMAGGVSSALVPWTASAAILSGFNVWNELKVVCSGANMSFYANGTLLTSIADASFASGKVGVKAYDVNNAVNVKQFDNVALTCSAAPPAVAGEAVTAIPLSQEQSESSK